MTTQPLGSPTPAPSPTRRIASRGPRPCPAVAWIALLLVAQWGVACSGQDSDLAGGDPDTGEAAAALGEGGALLHPIAPPERSDLWPLGAGLRLQIVRQAVGESDELIATVDGPSSDSIRVAPFASVPTSFRLQVRDSGGSLLGQATTAAALIDAGEPDRELHAFLWPVGAAVTVVDTQGKAVSGEGLLGSTATRTSAGEAIFMGGSAYAGGAPCGLSAIGKPSSGIWRFDPSDHALVRVAELSQPRSFHTAASLPGSRIFALGGYTTAASGDLAPTASVELLRTQIGAVQPSTHGLSVARARHCAVVVGARVVLAGGVGAAGGTVELWDPAVGTVGSPAPLYPPRRDAGCAVAVDPLDEQPVVFVVGGVSGSTAVTTAVPYKVRQDGLESYQPIALPGGQVSQFFVHARGPGLSIWVAGGFADLDATTPLDKVWVNLLSSSAASGWKALPALKSARGCAAAAVTAGRAVLAGGMGASGEPLATVDVVDLQGGGPIAADAVLPMARAGATALEMADGAVLIAGGVQLKGDVAVAAPGLVALWPGAP